MVELVAGSELEGLLRLDVEDLRWYAGQIVLALQFLHSQRIGHFDLKGQNVMVDDQGHLKLIDFGMSEVVEEPLCQPKESTAHFLAPEIMRINRHAAGVPGYGLPADVWSFGGCLYYFHLGYMPSACEENLIFDIYNVVLYDYADLPQYDDIEDNALANLLQASLQRCPTDRPTFDQLARQPFLWMATRLLRSSSHEGKRKTLRKRLSNPDLFNVTWCVVDLGGRCTRFEKVQAKIRVLASGLRIWATRL